MYLIKVSYENKYIGKRKGDYTKFKNTSRKVIKNLKNQQINPSRMQMEMNSNRSSAEMP